MSKTNVKAVAILLSGALCAGSIAAGAQVKGAAISVTGGEAVSSGEPQAQTRIVGDFSDFAGSDANARSLVAGLRHGNAITLTAPAAGGQPGTATGFTPPTRRMDYGDVRISLALAREQLAQLDITRPTPAQIKAVLAGGGVASRTGGRVAAPFLLPGVLQMRASGMGWAKIADTMGVTLGQAMNSKAHHAAFSAPPASLHPAAASAAGGLISAAVARSDVTALRRTGATPAPIFSASITTTVAASTRTTAVAMPPALARRSTNGETGPDIRRSRARIVAAADSVVKGGVVAMPVQDGARGGDVRTVAAAVTSTASNEPIGSEDGQTAD
jgi:hypothetical protein